MLMSPQARRPAREYVPVRLSPDGLDEVRRLAEIETEGNVSQMIRKLLTEALAVRAKQADK